MKNPEERMREVVIALEFAMTDPERTDAERFLAAEGLETCARNGLAENSPALYRKIRVFLDVMYSDPATMTQAAVLMVKWELV